MAEAVKQNNDTNVPPPFYVEYGVKEREQFLSDLGNFSPPQYEVFQTLCKMWQPEIPYNKFMTQISGAIKNVAAELDRVLDKLSQKKCGLLKIHYSSGEQVRDSIILTEPAAPRFFYYATLNELEIFFSGMEEPVPYEDYLESRGVKPPSVRNLEPGQYSVIFEDAKEKKDYRIYRVVLPNRKALLLPAGGGMRYINFCLGRLRESLADTNMASGVARVQQISMNELYKRAESKDPMVILGIAKAIQQLRHDTVETRRFQVAETLFGCMLILAYLISCNIEEIKRRKGVEEDLRQDKNALLHLIEGESDPLIPEKRFTELVNTFKDKYKDNFENFRKDFMETVLTQQGEEKIPVIISISNSYIHRNNFFHLFLSSLNIFRVNAEQFTVKTMEQILRTNNREGNTIFYSKENFDTGLKTFLRQSDPRLYEMFNNSKILSEVIIYTLKTKKKVRELEVIETELGKYFTQEAMQLKGLSSILHISLIDVFHRAFFHLAWWRQLLIKFSGKYASYENLYSRQGYKNINGSPQRQTGASDRAAAADLPETANGSSAAAGTRQHRKKGARNSGKKDYTKRQQENAWNEFSKTIRPDK
ncbi:MAG: hypothetical protein LBK44_03080 [Spirochaetales bacterium]|jgi:hypothetical protein|nr:hypothetical protein [Spirochaetales bacterium]